MSSIVRQYNKQNNTTYVYRSESCWIPGVGPRNKRTLIGKIDPETGEIVPTGKRGRPPKFSTSTSELKKDSDVPGYDCENQDTLYSGEARAKAALLQSEERVRELEGTIKEQCERITELENKLGEILKSVSMMEKTVHQCIEAFNSTTIHE